MKKETLIAVIIIAVIVAGIVGAAVGNSFERPDPSEFDRDEFKEVVKRDPKPYLIIKGAVSMINLVIAVILISLYIQTYRSVRSEFTLGLIIVMTALLIYALMSNPLMHLLFGFKSFGLGPFLLLPDVFASVAMSILLYLSLK